MTLTALVFVVVAVGGAVQRVAQQYLLAAPRVQSARAARLRVGRRHLESLRAWEARTVAAEEALTRAADAFAVEAARVGRIERLAHDGLRWSLPGTHPLAVALVAARYPDGPSPQELLQVAGGEVVEVGVDDTIAVPS